MFERIIKEMTEGILVTDEKGEVLFVNPSLKQLLCLNKEGIGERVLELVRNNALYELIEQVLKGESVKEEKEILFFVGREEKHILVHSGKLLLASGRNGSVSVFNDVTPLRKLENARKDFVANVSHELKTPLTNIRGFAETLRSGALQDPKVAGAFLEKIESNAIQLQSLVEDILKLSEIESGRLELILEEVDLKELLEEIQNGFSRPITLKNVEWKIKTDRSALRQILSNLIDNAVKYTPAEGNITVEADREGDSFKISVIDTGTGIAPQDLQRIFERFYRVDKSRSREMGGTGLGLAIVKHLVQLLGGEVFVESELEKGSRFFFTLPQTVS